MFLPGQVPIATFSFHGAVPSHLPGGAIRYPSGQSELCRRRCFGGLAVGTEVPQTQELAHSPVALSVLCWPWRPERWRLRCPCAVMGLKYSKVNLKKRERKKRRKEGKKERQKCLSEVCWCGVSHRRLTAAAPSGLAA